MMTFDEIEDLLARDGRRPQGIGTKTEQTVHRAIKYWLCPDSACHEVRIGRRIADVLADGRVYEIQTRAFHAIAPKVAALLEDLPVTVVYPVITKKTVYPVATDGTIGRGRVSPRKGQVASILPELYGLRRLVGRPGLDFLVLCFEASEYRSGDAARPGRRSVRRDLLPRGVPAAIRLAKADDFRALVPEGLADVFTVKQLGKALRMRAYETSKAALFLREARILEVCGRDGRAFLYRVLPADGVARTSAGPTGDPSSGPKAGSGGAKKLSACP